MQYIKDVTNEIGKLTNLYSKLMNFKDFEDLEELSDLMGTNTAIENVINWINGCSEEIPELIPEPVAPEMTVKIIDRTEIEPQPIPIEIVKTDVPLNNYEEEEEKETVKVDLSRFIDKLDKTLAKVAPELLEKEKENEKLQQPLAPQKMYAAITLNGEPIPEDYGEEEEEELDVTDPSNDGFIETAPTMDSYEFPADIMKKIITSYNNKDWLRLYDGEWRRNTKYPVMQSKTGLFWDLSRNEQSELKWMSGDLRVNVSPKGYLEDHKLCGTMMCAMWHLKRPYDNENFVFTVKDGDRRNLNVTNLTYENKDVQLMPQVRLVHDICQRAIECNFNVTKILRYYEGSSPSVSARWISELINKTDKNFVSITDAYWKIENGKPKIVKTDDTSKKKPSGQHQDVVAMFYQLKDLQLCSVILMDKIANGYDLTHQEKELLVCVAKWDLPSNQRFFAEITKHIREKFGWDMSEEETKGFLNHRGPISHEFDQVAVSRGGKIS